MFIGIKEYKNKPYSKSNPKHNTINFNQKLPERKNTENKIPKTQSEKINESRKKQKQSNIKNSNINIVANGEMIAKASHFTGTKDWRTYLNCVHIIPSILGGINIIACNGWELLVFYDPKGECSKADGISIDFNKSKLKIEAKKIKNCKKKVYIRGPYSNPECRFNLKQYKISIVNHSTKNYLRLGSTMFKEILA